MVFCSTANAVITVTADLQGSTSFSAKTPASRGWSDSDTYITEWSGENAGTSSAVIGYKVQGWASSADGGSNNYPLNFTVTWNINADAGETYDFNLNTAFNALLVVEDDAGDETNDKSEFQGLTATVTLNANPVAAGGLNLASGSRTVAGTSLLDRSGNFQFSNLTGSNTIVLNYTGKVETASNDGFLANKTANAVLWGKDGQTTSDRYGTTFDDYASAIDRNGDGLTLTGTVEITAVPEPATMAPLLGLITLSLVCLRRSKRAMARGAG